MSGRRLLAAPLASLLLAALSACQRDSPGDPIYLTRDVPSVAGLISSTYLHRASIPADMTSFASVESLLAALNDPFTYERTPQQATENTQGVFTGSKGFTVAALSTFVFVNEVDPAGPAWQQGLRRKDVLVRLDGQPVDASTQDLAALLARDPLSIEVARAGQPLTFQVASATFTAQSVVDVALDATTHHVSISRFFEQTVDPSGPSGELLAVLQANPGVTRWVLDLRWNGGGSLGRACELVDLFAAAGAVVSLVDWTGASAQSCSAVAGHPGEGKQVAVLLNGGSASSSEVVAAALRDLVGAPLVGEVSYGKGVAQAVWPYASGGQLLLVTWALTSASGTTWHGGGLTPDVVNALDPALLADAGRDSQLEAALAALAGPAPRPAAPRPAPGAPVDASRLLRVE